MFVQFSLSLLFSEFKTSLKRILISGLDTRLTGELGAETSAREKAEGAIRKVFGEADATLKTELNANIKNNVLVFTHNVCFSIFIKLWIFSEFKSSLKHLLISALDTRLTGELGAETSAREKAEGAIRKEFGEADTALKTELNADIKNNVSTSIFVFQFSLNL